jgi:hypothetical protein
VADRGDLGLNDQEAYTSSVNPSETTNDNTVGPTTPDENATNAEDYVPEPGADVADVVPMENWVYWPPSDSADYLDANDITYRKGGDGDGSDGGGGDGGGGDEDEGEGGDAGGMSEQAIRDAGYLIDLPYEAPSPVALKYKDTGQQVWTPPPGFRQGLPPLPGQDQEGVEGGSSSGEEPGT